MRDNDINFSEHAIIRIQQRNLTIEDVIYVLVFGQVFYRTGARIYFLRRRDVPVIMLGRLGRLVGTTVIVAGNEVVTAYRNQIAISKIKRKSKHYVIG